MLGKDCPKYLITDKECVIRAQKGEEDALRVLCERYNKPIYQYVRLKIAETEDARDITSQVFSKIIDNINQLGPPYNFKNWLYTIVNNSIRDFIRTQKGKPDCIADDLPDDNPKAEKPGQDNFYNPLSINVISVMKRLDPIEEQVLFLWHFKDLNYSEIALGLGKTENNIRLIMHRAKKNFLRLYLQRYKSPIYLGGEKNEKK